MSEYPRDQLPRAFTFTPENCPLRDQGFESYEETIKHIHREYGPSADRQVRPYSCSECHLWHFRENREKEINQP